MGNNIKIGIVEDNHVTKASFENMIRSSAGFELVGSYANGKDALMFLPKVDPHVVVMDINLGDMSGVDVISRLRQQNPSISFMVCTVEEDDGKIFQALAAGADGYILKTAKSKEIISAIKDLYNGGASLQGCIAKKLIERMRLKTQQISVGLECLSNREDQILKCLLKGKFYKEIAAELSISLETVRKHVHHIYQKLNVGNRLEIYNKFKGDNIA